MASTTRGSNPYIPGHKPKHIANHTWRTAENSSAYVLPTLKEKVLKNPQIQALDCAAGPGTITASLAKYFPQGHIIATDLSPEIVAQAAEYARSIGVTNVSAQVASIYDLPFESDKFDFVHAGQILCHLDQPLKALKEMIRVCKPGGIVAVRESDVRMFNVWPEVKGLMDTLELWKRVMEASGGSYNMGVRLLSLALEAGIERSAIQASMGTWSYSTPEEREIWGGTIAVRLREGNMRNLIVEHNLGWTLEQLDAMADDWDKWIETEDGWFGAMNGEIIITKP